MSETRYTENHEWAQLDGDTVTIGITNYAQEQLGDIVYVELPEVGRVLEQDEESAVIESVKAAGELKSPVAGEVIEVNDTLADAPESVNESAESSAWFFKVKITDTSEFAALKDADAYKELCD